MIISLYNTYKIILILNEIYKKESKCLRKYKYVIKKIIKLKKYNYFLGCTYHSFHIETIDIKKTRTYMVLTFFKCTAISFPRSYFTSYRHFHIKNM